MISPRASSFLLLGQAILIKGISKKVIARASSVDPSFQPKVSKYLPARNAPLGVGKKTRSVKMILLSNSTIGNEDELSPRPFLLLAGGRAYPEVVTDSG